MKIKISRIINEKSRDQASSEQRIAGPGDPLCVKRHPSTK